MLRTENMQEDKVISALECLRLSAEEMELAEKYLSGEASEEALTGIKFRNLISMAKSQEYYKPFWVLFESYFSNKRFEEAARLLHLMYAISAYTCSECFLYIHSFKQAVEKGELQIDRSMALAVYAQHLYMYSYRHSKDYTPSRFILTDQMETLAEFAMRDPAIVHKALQEFDPQCANGNILLYTLYFYLRYNGEEVTGENIRPVQDTGAAVPAPVEILPQDQELLREYESILVDVLEEIFVPNPSVNQAIREIQESIRKGCLQEGQLEGICKKNVDSPAFMAVCSCAFVNYMLSAQLRDVMRVCGAAAPSRFLNALDMLDPRGEFERVGDRLQELFGLSGRSIMVWAVSNLGRGKSNEAGKKTIREKILPAVLRREPTVFLASYKKAKCNVAGTLADIIKAGDPEMYQREVLSQSSSQREQVINLITDRLTCAREAREYLEGKADLTTLYPFRTQLGGVYGGYFEREALEEYDRIFHDEEFFSRCMGLMALGGRGHFLIAPLFNDETILLEPLERCFQGMDRAGIDLDGQLQIVSLMVDCVYSDTKKYDITHGCIPIFQRYLAERTQEMENAFARAGAVGRYFALLVYGSEAKLQVTEELRETCGEALAEFAKGKDAWREQILSYSQDSSKQVKQELEKMLVDRPGWREQVTQLLSSKKAAEREMGIRVLAGWNTSQDREALQALYEREKNARIRTLLDTVLGRGAGSGEAGSGSGSAALTKEDLVKNLHKGGKKRSLAWAYETPFSLVHTKSGELVSEEYLQALLLCYNSMTKPGISGDAALLAEDLEPQELAIYVGELFDKWMEAGAEAKKRWVLYAASIHGGSDIIKRLYHQIQEWPQNARGAIAAEAVQALALNPQPQALLIVDGIARKFKFKQVKTAAGQALEFAAGQLGLTREQLEDKIVPSLGFDEHMERRFDYGSRSFTVTITPALEVEIFDESGKKLKNMPAPGAKDDAEKAAAAYGEFKEMKKQMKTTVSSQKQRLEMALSTERLWTVPAWQELFVRNPIMHQFAIGLIWGVYEDHKLVQSFRYMEDGSFNTENEEEFILPGTQPESAPGGQPGSAPGGQSESGPQGQSGTVQGQIGLVHPLELSEESLETWKQQLEDYEITQPIEQLERAVYHLAQEEQEGKSLERFGGMLINDLSLGGKLTTLGWYRGSVQDAGCFYTYYREDASLGLGAELHFSGSFVGSGVMGGEEVTVYDVRFYKAGTIERGSYCYDEVEGEKQILLKDIPPRYFSEIVWQLTKATASSKERNEDWKAKAR